MANVVSGNDYTPTDAYSCGVLIYQTNGVRLQNNLFDGNEKDTCVMNKGGTYDPYDNGQTR